MGDIVQFGKWLFIESMCDIHNFKKYAIYTVTTDMQETDMLSSSCYAFLSRASGREFNRMQQTICVNYISQHHEQVVNKYTIPV